MRPDYILYNTLIATQCADKPFAQSVAIEAGKIVAVGTDAEVLKTAGAKTRCMDLSGRLVLPGFIDSHIHFYEWALKRGDLHLENVRSLGEMLGRVRERAYGSNSGQWIMGQGWNETDWHEVVMPSRDMLDQAAPDNPVLLWRCDLHLAVVNSAALLLAGIDDKTRDPAGGTIERDEKGRPTGILRELAINLIRRVIPPPEPDEVLRCFKGAMSELHAMGITGIEDIRLMNDRDGARAFRAFHTLNRERALDLRCWVSLPGHLLDDAIDLGLQTGFGDEYLRIGHVKYFADGGVGARTAWMVEPFCDAGTGMATIDVDEMQEALEKADQAGLSVMIHAVGDRANREVISLFEKLVAHRKRLGYPGTAIPHRIEHVQVIQPEDVLRLGVLPLTLCVTPCNMVLDMNLIDQALAERGAWSYAFRQLHDSGARVIYSSDSPVCDPRPIAAIHAAVTRNRPDNTPANGWHPQERVTVAEAAGAYTAAAAAAHGLSDLGLIKIGARADLVVLDKNIYAIDREEIQATDVVMTIFDGRIVFQK